MFAKIRQTQTYKLALIVALGSTLIVAALLRLLPASQSTGTVRSVVSGGVGPR